VINGTPFMLDDDKLGRWERVYIPKRFRGATFETFRVNEHNKRMFETVKAWVESCTKEQDRGLLLGGTIGTGKTHLMYAMGRELARRGRWPVYKNFASVCIEMKNAWREKESGTYLKEMMQEADILLLDDLGAEMREKTEQGWVTEMVYELVEVRYNDMLPTVIATNLAMSEIATRYTGRVASRLAEMSVALWVEGYDYRLQGRAG
jgi:DNA replication protein DnaC